MATRNSLSLSVIESELSSALTEALVSTGLVEAEEERFDNAKYTTRTQCCHIFAGPNLYFSYFSTQKSPAENIDYHQKISKILKQNN